MELKKGETYIINTGFNNSGDVILVHVYGKHFCRVKDPETGAEWDVMINRLTPKAKK